MTDHVEVLRMILDGRISGRISEWPQIKPAIEYAITALSARASAGEGGEAERSRFHAYVRARGGDVVQREGEYISSMTRLWWDCWQVAAAPQPAQAGASGGGGRCLAEQDAKHLGTGYLVDGERVAPDRIEIIAAVPQPQEVQRPSADWYRRKIMEGDGVEAMAGPLPPFHVCSNPSARHRHGADPMGHCPDCVAQGLGNWSCTPESPTPPAHGDGGVVAETLRMLLQERNHRTDGDLQALADRCLHLSRGDRDLIDIRGRMLDEQSTRPTPEAQEARGAALLAKWIIRHRDDFPSWITVDHACAQCVPDGDLLMPGFVCAYHVAERIDAARAVPAQGEGNRG